MLTNCLFYYMILPLLCGSLISMTKPKIAISVSLYIILVLFHFIKDESFLNLLFSILFSDRVSKKVMRYMEEYPKNTKNYHYDWSSQKKLTYNSFTNYVTFNFSEPFLRSLIYMNNSQYSEVLAIVKKYERMFDDKDNTININSPSFFQNLLEDVLAKFSNSEIDIMTTYHKNISIATGVNVGLSLNDNKNDSFLKIMERVYEKIKNENLEELDKKFLKNECRENLYSYLRVIK
jgi:hypothetical protein